MAHVDKFPCTGHRYSKRELGFHVHAKRYTLCMKFNIFLVSWLCYVTLKVVSHFSPVNEIVGKGKKKS